MSAEANRWRISLMPHLRHRMRERCPDMKPARAVDEVREAIAAGRISTERPAWLHPRKREHPLAGISLYAWTPEQERAYVLHTTPSEFVVMSVLTGDTP